MGSQRRVKAWGGQRGKSLGQRKRQKCIPVFSFANPLFISLGVKSRRILLENRQLRGCEGILTLLVRYLLKYNESRPPPLNLSLYTAASPFSVWKKNRPSLYPLQLCREGRQTDLMEAEKQKSPSSFLNMRGPKLDILQKSPMAW